MSSRWKVYVTTLNCAKKFPFDSGNDISEILREVLPESFEHDIYALGFQELMSTWEASFPSLTTPLFEDVSNAIATYVNAQSSVRKFRLVGRAITGAVGLVVLADERFKIEKVTTSIFRCGLFNSSLKGAASICCGLAAPNDVQDTFTFICSHLSANEGVKNAELRVSNYECIMSACATDLRMTSFRNSHIFYFGDLNFRVKGWQDMATDYSNAQVLNNLLKDHDELNKLRESNLVFQGFDESPISFPPTYKYLISTQNTFDTRKTPSWCDRVLFRRYLPESFKIRSYRSVDRTSPLRFTDHQGVVLDIEVPSNFSASPLDIPASIIPAHQLLIGDVMDTAIGYVGWGIAKKLHYWVAIILGLMIIYNFI
ncbi:hypothetical protein HG536_0G02580 [Torulaspora globosa]|uniref:Inositol polyphosphate-related phosphatase domain-containing protein n=1 Tax=Torulaspora globosa TaxID=48254 RepID=A0A7G3ZLL1_9SACH|nr:uncharacterized protein HG536_0G02580 [Torulaspora globosa]QLL34397.1 hypothetical protein HG536_0G02580 [Torulaspora globosa]